MAGQIYEVLDSVADGVRLQIEFQPRVNSSLIASGVPFVRAIVVHNESGHELGAVTVSVTLDATTWTHMIDGPLAVDSATRIDNLSSFAGLVNRASEATAATLTAMAAPGPSITAAIEVSAHNEWLNLPGMHAALTAFVQPNTRAVTRVLRAASDLLLKRTDSGSLDGYQSGPERVNQIAGAIYEALRGLEITYINPPASFELTGQKVRTTEQVVADRFGTCVDLSVLYAACLEAAGLFPVIFVTDHHSFGGFYAQEQVGEKAELTDANVLTNLVETGLVHPVELTAVGPGKNSLDFRKATEAATGHFRIGFGMDTLRSMVDVRRARIEGVAPMPSFTSADDVPADLEADRPFVAKSSLKNLSIQAEEEVVRGRLESKDDSPARFKQWKRDLLDLSLRNPLLNMPHTSKVLDLVVPSGMLSQVDDVVHSGKSVRLLGGIDSSDLQQLAGSRMVNELSAEVLQAQFANNRSIYSMRDDLKHRAQLRAMKREADTLEQETGSNYLYLTLGTLVHPKPNGGEARAPLFLLPVRITGGLAFTSYSMKLDGDETAQPNLVLLEWLKSTRGLDLDELAHPLLDDSGIAIGAVFAAIRKRLVEAELPYRLDESASLAILRFSTFQIWKDLDAHWAQLMQSPVVEHLVNRPGETFADPAGSELPPIDEKTLRLPIAADGSQMAAIVRATSGQSFVLEGPPGTGKSQTITNLIAHALGAGKKVLFVAEKQAALEVVKRRLDAVGLGAFGLELHGAKQSMRSIRDQLKASLSLTASVDANAWAATNSRLTSAISTLEHYPSLVHSTNAAGHSLWSAYDAVVGLGDGPTATVPTSWLAAGTDLQQVTADFASAATRYGLRREHHWLVSGATDAAALGLPDVQAALADLAAVRPLLANLTPAWASALSEAPPAAALDAVLLLLAAATRGELPSAGHLAYIDRPSWRDAVAALTSALTSYRASHPIIQTALPAAFDAPDLADIRTRSAALDKAWFFPSLRRRKILARAQELFSTPIENLTETIDALRAAIADSALEVPQGLLLPAGWRPWHGDASATLDRAHHVALTAVWASTSAPHIWALLPDTSAMPVLEEVSGAWKLWLAAIGGSEQTVSRWSSTTSWVASWARDEPAWKRDVETSELLQLQRLTEVNRQLERLAEAGLDAFALQLGSVSIAPGDATEALLRGVARASVEERRAAGSLDSFDSDAHDRASEQYLTAAANVRQLLTRAGPADLLAKRPFKVENLRGEVAELARQLERKRGGLSFREITARYPDALQSVAPVFLMSPGSVAHYLDPASLRFDLVIFDEASQVRVSQSIGAMGRGRAVIVVGDSRQMPPTRVMQVEVASEQVDAAEDVIVEDLESILTEAVESGLPQLWLQWHYRSQDERLIAFSNSRYYDSRLISLPSAGETAGSGVEWRRVQGVFDRGRSRTNEIEASAIVDEITARLRNPATARDSIGVVCFNIQQRDLILNKLEDSADLLVQQALQGEPQVALFVKNLENVQGDERDVILFSLAFSLDPATGVLPLNFGPLNLAGGERRLNVAVTRAKKNIVLFSSFDPSDIDPRRSSARGIADLKAYLEFAATRKSPTIESTDASLSNRGRFIDELASAVRELGFEVETDLGLSAFRVDLAIRKPGDDSWRLAVMVDGPGWNSRLTVADRDGSPQLLRDLMRWRGVERVWLPGWIRDRKGVLDRIESAVNAVPESAEAPAAAVAAAPVPEAVEGPVTLVASARPQTRGGAEVGVFTPAEDSVIASQSVLNNMQMAKPAIVRIAGGALETEGPTALPRLMTTIAKRFGYSRIGDAKRSEILRVVSEAFTVVDGFAWPFGTDPASFTEVRRTMASDDRSITEISPQEVGNAFGLVLREAMSATRDDLFKEAASVLGYSRLTETARTWLAKVLATQISSGRIADDGSRLRLAAG
jgi:hypothetical protein